MTDRGEELDGTVPLLLGNADLANERVQVPDERLEDDAQPLIGRGIERLLNDADQPFLALALLFFDGHGAS